MTDCLPGATPGSAGRGGNTRPEPNLRRQAAKSRLFCLHELIIHYFIIIISSTIIINSIRLPWTPFLSTLAFRYYPSVL